MLPEIVQIKSWYYNDINPSIDYLINVEGSFLHFFWLLSLQNLDYKLISVIWCGEQSWKVPDNAYLLLY